MKYRDLFVVLICLILSACTRRYDQYYQTYADFDKQNKRLKTWFPEIISSDAYDLRNASYLDSLCAFGTFSYSADHFYDSVFGKVPENKIDVIQFEQKVYAHLKRKPSWFPEPGNISGSGYEAVQAKSFLVIRKAKARRIYFVLSN